MHEKEGKIFAQLWHAGSISHPDLLEGKLQLAPSAVNPYFKCFTKNGFQNTIVPKEMTSERIEDIEQTIVDFQQAAVNAIEAGFDGVELHAANGYLLHQFFAKCSNLRTDNYGGTIQKRAKILFDILDRISLKVPLSKVGVRIALSLHNTFGIVTDNETDALFEYITTRLNDYGLAYLHISGYSMDTIQDPFQFVWDTAKRYRTLYNGTLIINKGFTKETANKVLEEGIADMVSFDELFISNPDLAERFEHDLPLQAADRSTFYVPGPKGHTDYPVIIYR